jgi:hypothetical protein
VVFGVKAYFPTFYKKRYGIQPVYKGHQVIKGTFPGSHMCQSDRGSNTPPVYGLDATDVLQWKEKIL